MTWHTMPMTHNANVMSCRVKHDAFYWTVYSNKSSAAIKMGKFVNLLLLFHDKKKILHENLKNEFTL